MECLNEVETCDMQKLRHSLYNLTPLPSTILARRNVEIENCPTFKLQFFKLALGYKLMQENVDAEREKRILTAHRILLSLMRAAAPARLALYKVNVCYGGNAIIYNCFAILSGKLSLI